MAKEVGKEGRFETASDLGFLGVHLSLFAVGRFEVNDLGAWQREGEHAVDEFLAEIWDELLYLGLDFLFHIDDHLGR